MVNTITALTARVEELEREREDIFLKDRLRTNEHNILTRENRELRARVGELEGVLNKVLVGGNHLVSIIGIPHPAQGMTHEYVLAHYGPGHQYDAWCCWNAIMEARAAITKGEREG